MTDQNEYNRKLIAEFRANGGKLAERPLVLLTTTGARSGQPRTTPLMYIRDGARLLVIASNMGAPNHPAWYHNLVAHPEVTVEADGETFEATASVAAGAERERLWGAIVSRAAFFAEHQAKIDRQIPVVVLERRAG